MLVKCKDKKKKSERTQISEKKIMERRFSMLLKLLLNGNQPIVLWQL